MIPLRTQYLIPLAQLLFPVWVDDGQDSYKAFIIYCAIGEDLNLLYHFDNAEVMLNVNCDKQFTGGYLHFGKIVKMCTFCLNNVQSYVYSLIYKQALGKHKDLHYKQIDINFWQEFHITLMRSLDYQGVTPYKK